MGSIPTGGSDTPTRYRVGVFVCVDGAGLLGAPVGGGPPARRPRCELRSARRLEARPGPATAHGRRSLACQSLRRPPHRRRCVAVRVWARRLEARFWLPNSNSARNSRFTVSNFEFVSLELQRFREVLNNDRDKLRAKFIRCLSHRCAWSSAAGSTNPSAREAMGGFAALEAGWRRISGVSQL